MWWRILLTYLFNLIDWVLTRHFLKQEGFVEQNPFMRLMMKYHLDGFWKVAWVGIALIFLWEKRYIKLAQTASWIGFIFYAVVIVWWGINLVIAWHCSSH